MQTTKSNEPFSIQEWVKKNKLSENEENIEGIDTETYIHLINNDSTQGYCILSSQINN